MCSGATSWCSTATRSVDSSTLGIHQPELRSRPFDEDLIEELQADCQRSVTVTEDEVILHHVYTERRLYPLDLYLREMAPDRARKRRSITAMPSRTLPRPTSSRATSSRRTSAWSSRRRGLLRLRRTRLCRRSTSAMPVSQSYEDEMLDQPWFPVDNDVFPEEFRTYLRSPRSRRRGVRRGAPGSAPWSSGRR